MSFWFIKKIKVDLMIRSKPDNPDLEMGRPSGIKTLANPSKYNISSLWMKEMLVRGPLGQRKGEVLIPSNMVKTFLFLAGCVFNLFFPSHIFFFRFFPKSFISFFFFSLSFLYGFAQQVMHGWLMCEWI